MDYYKREKLTALSVLVGAFVILFYIIPNYIDRPQAYEGEIISTAFFPTLAAWWIAGLAVLYLANVLVMEKWGSSNEDDNGWLSTSEECKAYIISIVIIIYLIIINYIGFMASSILLMIILLMLQGIRNPIKLILTSILVPVGVNLFFLYVMNVHFPKGIFFE